MKKFKNLKNDLIYFQVDQINYKNLKQKMITKIK